MVYTKFEKLQCTKIWSKVLLKLVMDKNNFTLED